MRNLLLASAAATALLVANAAANAQTISADEIKAKLAPSGEQYAQNTNMGEDRKQGAKSAQPGQRQETTGPAREQSRGGASGAEKGAQRPEGKNERNAQGMQREDRMNGAQKSGASEPGRQTTGAAPNERHQGKSSAEKSGSPETQRQTTGTSQGSAEPNGRKPGGPKAGASTQNNQKTNQPNQSSQSSQNNQKTGSPDQRTQSSQGNQRSTTGQSPAEQRTKGDRETQGNPPTNQNRPDRNTSPSGAPANNEAGMNRNSQTGSAAATEDKTAKFNQVIEKQKVRSVDNINVNVSVGTSLPRSVTLHDVPSDIVTVYPEYRGKKFVVVRDEIIVVEPGTRKIVATIPRSGRATTGASTSSTTVRQSTSAKIQLAPEQRRKIRETVIKEQAAPRCSDVPLTVGGEVPRSLQLQPLPQDIVRDVPELRSYNFCLKNNQVVLIDPTEYRIVEVIE